jgi:hypothetical protein
MAPIPIRVGKADSTDGARLTSIARTRSARGAQNPAQTIIVKSPRCERWELKLRYLMIRGRLAVSKRFLLLERLWLELENSCGSVRSAEAISRLHHGHTRWPIRDVGMRVDEVPVG